MSIHVSQQEDCVCQGQAPDSSDHGYSGGPADTDDAILLTSPAMKMHHREIKANANLGEAEVAARQCPCLILPGGIEYL